MKPTTEEIVSRLREHADAYEGSVFSLELYRAADRLEMMEAELTALKEKNRWIPVTERLPEDETDKFIKYGFESNGQLSEQRFMGASCYYLHDPNPHWNNEGFKSMKVTHWIEPPKEESS